MHKEGGPVSVQNHYTVGLNYRKNYRLFLLFLCNLNEESCFSVSDGCSVLEIVEGFPPVLAVLIPVIWEQ